MNSVLPRAVLVRMGALAFLLPAITLGQNAGAPGAGQAPASTTQSCAPPPVNERSDPLPPELQGVGIDEHLNEVLPLDTQFTDASGQAVTLRDYFDGKHPVVLTLNYYRCPML